MEINQLDNSLDKNSDCHQTAQGLESSNACKDKLNIEECEDDDGVFYFESDHLALKGNLDYCKLIKSVSLLEAQRIKILQDIESLYALKEKVKERPLYYAEKILSGDVSDIPSQVVLEEVPKIDWSKYNIIALRGKNKQHQAPDPVAPTKREDAQQNIRIRGRVYDQTKPQTFNQLWTAEEQLRLEELLVQFPPERIEFNRYRKIAEALGNRTPKQVCSRVQKYFIKLQKAGIAIPGHPIKSSTKKNSKLAKRFFYKNSTFFPTMQFVPLSDSDQEEDQQEDEDEMLDDKMKIEILVKVKEYKEKEENMEPFFHDGISCTMCGEEPLQGTRWQCLDCQDVNMCSDCLVSQLDLEVPEHPPSHKLEPLGDPASASWDPDYRPASFATNNYLDPNYMPV